MLPSAVILDDLNSIRAKEGEMRIKGKCIAPVRHLRKHVRLNTVLVVMVAVLLAVPASALAMPPASPTASVAPDGPGALAYFDLARKDCLGTARNTTS